MKYKILFLLPLFQTILPISLYAQFIKPTPIDSTERVRQLELFKKGTPVPDSSYYINSPFFWGMLDMLDKKENTPAIFLKIDRNTQKIYPFSATSKDTSYVFLKGTQTIQLIAVTHPSDLQKYLFRTTTKDTLKNYDWKYIDSNTLIPGWKNPLKLKVNHNPVPLLASQKAYLLGSFDVQGKQFTLQMLDLVNPQIIKTYYFYNKPLSKPQIIKVKNVIVHKSHNSRRNAFFNTETSSVITYPINNDTTHHSGIPINKIGNVRLTVRKEGPSAFYWVFLENLTSSYHKEKLISARWNTSFPNGINRNESDSSQESSVYMNIPGDYFQSPGTYKLTVVPGFVTPDLDHPILKSEHLASYFYFKIIPSKNDKK